MTTITCPRCKAENLVLKQDGLKFTLPAHKDAGDFLPDADRDQCKASGQALRLVPQVELDLLGAHLEQVTPDPYYVRERYGALTQQTR